MIYHYPAPETLGICYSFSDHTRTFCGFLVASVYGYATKIQHFFVGDTEIFEYFVFD